MLSYVVLCESGRTVEEQGWLSQAGVWKRKDHWVKQECGRAGIIESGRSVEEQGSLSQAGVWKSRDHWVRQECGRAGIIESGRSVEEQRSSSQVWWVWKSRDHWVRQECGRAGIIESGVTSVEEQGSLSQVWWVWKSRDHWVRQECGRAGIIESGRSVEEQRSFSSVTVQSFIIGTLAFWHLCPGRWNTGNKNTPSMHHPQRQSVATFVVGFKNGDQAGEPQRYRCDYRRRRCSRCHLAICLAF